SGTGSATSRTIGSDYCSAAASNGKLAPPLESEVANHAWSRRAINLLPVINAVLQRIAGLVPEIFWRTVTFPETTADSIPAAARQRLGNAVGIDLGDDFGVLTLYDADGLQAAQDGLRLFERAVIVLAVLTVGFTALAALWPSRRRRRTLLPADGRRRHRVGDRPPAGVLVP
ncbi:MAG: hypothetical protein ACRD0A_07110, partial [Acidimicrobiales bacterium]